MNFHRSLLCFFFNICLEFIGFTSGYYEVSFFEKRLTVFNKVTSTEYSLMFLFIIGRENADLT
jgi:hypothetical protein